MMVLEGEPDTELIVGLIATVIESKIITYNDGFADMAMYLKCIYKKISPLHFIERLEHLFLTIHEGN
jgi:hypothetical protein